MARNQPCAWQVLNLLSSLSSRFSDSGCDSILGAEPSALRRKQRRLHISCTQIRHLPFQDMIRANGVCATNALPWSPRALCLPIDLRSRQIQRDVPFAKGHILQLNAFNLPQHEEGCTHNQRHGVPRSSISHRSLQTSCNLVHCNQVESFRSGRASEAPEHWSHTFLRISLQKICPRKARHDVRVLDPGDIVSKGSIPTSFEGPASPRRATGQLSGCRTHGWQLYFLWQLSRVSWPTANPTHECHQHDHC